MSLIQHIYFHNRRNMEDFIPIYVPETGKGFAIGYIHSTKVELIMKECNIFSLKINKKGSQYLTFLPELEFYEGRTKAIKKVGKFLVEKKEIRKLRREYYAASETFLSRPNFHFDRALCSYFGFTARGVHINGYVERNNQLFMWIAQRSKNRSVGGGKYDNIIAGGQPRRLSLLENVIKEALGNKKFDLNMTERITKPGCSSVTF